MKWIRGILLASAFAASMGLARAENEEDVEDTPTLPATIGCVAYKESFQRALAAQHLLPPPRYTARKSSPTSVLLANYDDWVQAVIGCDEKGMFDGFGATAFDNAQPAQWRALVVAVIQGMDPKMTPESASAILATLVDGASAEARKNKVEPDGRYSGNEEMPIGNYMLDYRVTPTTPDFRIYLRYAK